MFARCNCGDLHSHHRSCVGGTLMGKHTTLRDHLLMWKWGAEGLSVIVEGHPGADARSITMLLEAHAYPGLDGSLKVVHAGAMAVDVLQGLRQATNFH